MYKLKEIAEILNVSDRTVQRYLNSYFFFFFVAYIVSEKMLEILKSEYLDNDSDTIVEEFTKDDYIEFTKRLSEYPFLKERAESEIAKYIELMEQTKEDMKRALELKEIINQANFEGELVVIKHRVSKSNWYDGNGVGNMRSRYNTCVPKSVEQEALELQAIRKKHQGNELFDFVKTAYITIEKREADHDNFKEVL